MEIHRHFQTALKLRDDRRGAQRIDQAGHILEGYDFGTESLHFESFFHEILVSKYFFRLRLAAEQAPHTASETSLGGLAFGIDSVTHRAVGYASKTVDHLDRLPYVVNIVESVEYTHHVQAIGYSLLVESLEHAVGIGHITEQVASARQSRQKRFSLHGLARLAQAIPGRFAEITHHRVGNGTAPHFHDIETCILIKRQQPVDSLLAHTGGEQRLLSVAHRQISDFKLSSFHNTISYLDFRLQSYIF